MSDFSEIYQGLLPPAEEPNDLTPIMIVDDNREIADAIRLTLQDRFRVVFCVSLEEALRSLTPDIEVILLDIQMATHDGIECFEKIRARRPDVKIIFHTAYAGSAKKAKLAEELDHNGILFKGDYTGKALNETIAAALGRGSSPVPAG